MVIYVDVLVAVNFFISYFLLITASVLSGYTYNRKRIFISALAGAIFCLYIFVKSDNLFIDIAVKTMSLMACALIAYGFKNIKKTVLQTLCFVLLNALLMGVTAFLSFKSSVVYQNNMFCYFNINPILLVALSAAVYLLITVFSITKERIIPDKTYRIDIFFDGFKLENISAFYDSGFKIKDIVSNRDVLILSIKKVEHELPKELREGVYSFLEENYSNVQTNFVPVFFNTLSGEGMVPAVKAKYIKVEGKTIENILAAFVKNELSENVTAIFGTDIKRQF